MDTSDYSFLDDAKEDLQYLNDDTRIHFRIGERAPAGMELNSHEKKNNSEIIQSSEDKEDSFEILERSTDSVSDFMRVTKSMCGSSMIVSLKKNDHFRLKKKKKFFILSNIIHLLEI